MWIATRSGHYRELIQKNFERIAFFKVVEQILDRHARTSENGCSALNVGVDDDDGIFHAGLLEHLYGEFSADVYR